MRFFYYVRIFTLCIFFSISGKAFAQITVDFTTPNNAGCPNPFLALINDASSSTAGSIVSWDWLITGPPGFTPVNSGSNSLAAPLDIPGLYNVFLEVCDDAGNCNSLTQNAFIEVFEIPSINYSITTPLSGCNPLEVCFEGTINPGCGTIQSSFFDLRDGTILTNTLAANPDFCYEYTSTGNYSNFEVSVTNSCGCATTVNINETVTVNPSPVASFTSSSTFSCTPPFTTTINSNSTIQSGASIEWNIPGLGISGQGGNSITETFPFGSYDVELIVINPDGCSDILLIEDYIVVGDVNAQFDSDTTATCAGGSINFFDNSTGSPQDIEWEIDGVIYSGSNINVNFPLAGQYDVKLTAFYPGGCVDSTIFSNYITIFDLPENSFDVTSIGSCVLPFTTTFNSTSTNSINSQWIFQGGTPNTFSGSGPVDVNYTNVGTYDVTLIDTSAQGCISQTVFQDTIDVTDLTLSINSDVSNGCIPLEVEFEVVLSLPETIASIAWDLPGSDVSTSNQENPIATYNSVGCYDVSVEVTTVSGCFATLDVENLICAGEPPTSSFSIDPPTGCFEEDEICFNYTGIGADTILWDYGDSSPITFGDENEEVCHTYSDDIGFYTITMIPFQYGCSGDTTTLIDAVEILGPIALFEDSFSCDDQRIRFFTNTSVESDSVFWDFGDGNTSSDDDPLHTYTDFGDFAVTLTAYNFTTGCEHSITQSVGVYHPTADFIASDTVICVGDQVNFQNTSDFLNSNFSLTRWDWDLSNGITFPNLLSTRGHNLDRAFNQIGVFSISVRNQDDNGCRDTLTKVDYIAVHGILGGFTNTSPREGCIPLTVSFEDTSEAPLTGIESWSWDFGNGEISNSSTPSTTYNSAGSYSVTLTVTDSVGCQRTFSYPDYVIIQQPTANFQIDNDFICNNQDVNISNTSVGNSLSYDWQFTNATPISYNTDGSPPPINFNSEGIQDIFLEVTDNFGCTDDTTLQVSVFDVVPAGEASINNVTCFNPPTVVNFTNLSVNNVDSSNVFWDFGNGSTSTQLNPSTTYNLAGTYYITLIANSQTGCADTAIVDSVIVGGPYAEITLIDSISEGCPCTELTFELLTVNATNPVFLPGDGNPVTINIVPLPDDTTVSTITYAYCNPGTFTPQLFIQEGACSGNISADNNVVIDEIEPDFEFSTIGICDAGEVCFTDLSENQISGAVDIIGWEWDFGDGNTSTDQNPCNFYNNSGFYEVQLIVENTFNCLDTIVQTVHIPESPSVSYGLSTDNGCLNIEVAFFDSTSIDSLAQIVSWEWDFDDLTTSDLQNPTHTFNSVGVYDVSLTVIDTFGCSGSFTSQVEVFPQPSVVASNDTIVCLGDSVQFNVSGAVSYFWTPNYFINEDSIENPIVAPLTDTTYFVTGTDINGCVNFDSVFVQVNSIVADFSFTPSCDNDTTFFTDLSSTINGTLTSWSWDFGDPTSGIDNQSNDQNPFHIYENAGVYDVNLEVTDDFGCIEDTLISLTVEQSPFASFIADSICLGQATSFNSNASNGGSGNIVSYEWDFDFNGETSTDQNPTFTYINSGVYNVCLTVTSDITCPSNNIDTCIDVIVYETPTAIFVADSVCYGNENIFVNNSTQGDGQILTNFWDFGQNVEDTLLQNDLLDANFTYDNFGVFDVTLNIEDEFGCTSSETNQAYVFDNPLADFSFNTLCENQTNEFISTGNAGLDNINDVVQYFWNFDDGTGFVLGDSIQNHIFQSNGNLDVSLSVIDVFGCTDTTTQNLDIIEAAQAAIVPSDTVVCNGQSLDLDASNSFVGSLPISYEWDLNFNSGIDEIDEQITYTPSQSSTVALFIEDASGCLDTAFQEITFLDNPIASFEYDLACEDIDFELSSNSTIGTLPILDYQWNINGDVLNGENVIYNHPDGNDDIVAQLTVIDEHGCTDTTEQTINVEEQPIINVLQTDYLVCLGGGVELTLNDTTLFEVSGVESYQWTPAFGIDDPTSDTIFMSPNISTIYTITGFSTNNICPPAETQIFVDIIPLPQLTIDATPNPILSGNTSDITVDVVPYNAQTDSLIWSDNSGTLFPLLGGNIEASPLEETTYDLTLIYNVDSVSCSLDTSVTIQVIDKCDEEIVYIPNIFTPNNDGKNDIFKINGIGLNNINRFIVFDRWGKLMYEEVNIPVINGRMQGGWNGINKNGKDCNSGVYVYRYEATCANGDLIEGSGNVTLIK